MSWEKKEKYDRKLFSIIISVNIFRISVAVAASEKKRERERENPFRIAYFDKKINANRFNYEKSLTTLDSREPGRFCRPVASDSDLRVNVGTPNGINE